MKSQKSYSEKLRDPRWQKKRLEVLEEYGWKCHSCNCDSEELHVHHPYYKKGLDPWDYENLLPLCRKCHERIGESAHVISEAISLLKSEDAELLSNVISSVLNKAESDKITMNIPMLFMRSLFTIALVANESGFHDYEFEDYLVPKEFKHS